MKSLAVAENPVEAFRLLVVSKESAVLRSLAALGESSRWQVEIASSGWDAMERMQSGSGPQLLLLDLPRGDGDSLHMLRWLRRLSPDVPVIAICDAEDALARGEAERLGAERILLRPLDVQRFLLLLRRYGNGAEVGALEMVRENVEQLDAFFVTASPVMQKLRAQAELLAQADVPVFIVGESGSGKDAVAKLIHKLSVRSGFRFLKVNCAAPEDLLEEQLFGSGRVFAATASGPPQAGKIEPAERGTIFLDEISEMPAGLQAKLLEALKNNDPRTANADPANPAEVRILSATSGNLERALAEEKLREDLYHRLSAFTLQVPALRQRKEEIPTLLRCAMHKLAKHYGLAAREFSPATLDACQQYGWPGNLTELETFVKRYLVAGDAELTASRADTPWAGGSKDNLSSTRALEFTATLAGRENAETPVAGSLTPKSLKSFIQDIKCEAERTAIGAALEKTGWNRKAAARLLRVSYRTLLYKIEQYQMKASEPCFSAAPVASLALEESGGKRNGKAS